MLRWLLLLSALLTASLLVACSNEKKDEPEIIESRPGRGEASSGAAPEIIGIEPGRSTLLIPSGVTTATSPGGLTLTRNVAATLPADQAFVVVLLPFGPTGPFPSATLPQRDRDAIIAAVQGLGIDPASVSFEANTNYGPFVSVNVEVGVSEVQTRGPSIVAAISAIRGAQGSGARFALRDCQAALAPLRKQAFDAATSDAQAFATAISITLGPVVGIAEAPSITPYGPATNACDPSSQLSKIPTTIVPLDSEPVVDLDLSLSVTFAIGNQPAQAGTPELSVSGTGSVKARANEAYVLIGTWLQGGGPFGPPQLQKRDRDELIDRITALDIDEDDIQIDSAAFGGPLLVYVEVEMQKLPQIGRDIARVVQEVLGGGAEQQGVHFTHSNCQAVLERALSEASVDAKRNADQLAQASGVTLGSLLSISEGGGALPGPYASPVSGCVDDFRLLFQQGPYVATVVPFDAPAEFTVSATLAVRYEISGP